jgi:hypothetical protein
MHNEKGINWAHVTASRAFFLMRWHDTSHRIIVCLPAARVHRRGYKLLNPGQKFKIIGIIKEIMCIIVLVQPNMLAWLHKASLPGDPEAVLALETYQQSLGA